MSRIFRANARGGRKTDENLNQNQREYSLHGEPPYYAPRNFNSWAHRLRSDSKWFGNPAVWRKLASVWIACLQRVPVDAFIERLFLDNKPMILHGNRLV